MTKELIIAALKRAIRTIIQVLLAIITANIASGASLTDDWKMTVITSIAAGAYSFTMAIPGVPEVVKQIESEEKQ